MSFDALEEKDPTGLFTCLSFPRMISKSPALCLARLEIEEKKTNGEIDFKSF